MILCFIKNTYFFLKPSNIYKKIKAHWRKFDFFEISESIFEYERKFSKIFEFRNLKKFFFHNKNILKPEILNFQDHFLIYEIIKDTPKLIKNKKFKRFFLNIGELFFWKNEKIENISDFLIFDDCQYQAAINFKDYLKTEKFVKEIDNKKHPWNISYYSYDAKLFWSVSKQKNDLESFLYSEFNSICCSLSELKNDFFYFTRNELNGIKKLLDEYEFPVFPLSSAIPLYLMKNSLFEAKNLLDSYKIKKNFLETTSIKDIFIKPYVNLEFQDMCLWNISEITEKMRFDYSFLYKYLLLAEKNFLIYAEQPFSNFYQKKYLSLSVWKYIWNKIHDFLSNLYISDPFRSDTEFHYFESLVLKDPEKCSVYMELVQKQSEQEHYHEMKRYIESNFNLYPKLPLDLNFSNLEGNEYLSSIISENKEEKNKDKKINEKSEN